MFQILEIIADVLIKRLEIGKELSEYSSIVTGILGSLISGWILLRMQLRHDQKELKTVEEKQMLDLRRKVMSDINYNITPGVGDAKCPFELVSIENLSHQKNLMTKLRNWPVKSLLKKGCVTHLEV